MRLAALLVLLLAGAAHADDGAREIMRVALGHSLLGFDHARLTVALTVKTSATDAGETRQIVVRTRRRGEQLDRTLCFLSPADVRNTTFLSVDGSPPEQFLWLPELGRLRQVSRASRSEPFLGTTFSYRDVEGWKLDDATYRKLADDKVGEHECQVIEATMKPDTGEYARVVSFVRKSDGLPLRVQFFDAGGKQVKALYTRRVDVQPGSAKVSYARSVRMEDLRGGGSTVLDIVEANFAADLAAELFTPEYLRRGLDCAP